MVAQREAFLVSKEAHTSIEVVAACEVEQGEAELFFRVNLDIDTSGEGSQLVLDFANTHEHLFVFVGVAPWGHA